MKTREELWEIGKEKVMSAPQLYVDVDVEADGIAGYGSMLAIGAQSPDGQSFYSEIRPASKEFLEDHRDFCGQHGLSYERLMDEAREFPEVIDEFHEWTKGLESQVQKTLAMTAFNAAFDWAFVDLYFTRSGIANPFGIAPVDLKSLALALQPAWDWDATRKSQLPEVIMPDGDFTHHALDDARYQQKLHFGMAALLGGRYESTMKVSSRQH